MIVYRVEEAFGINVGGVNLREYFYVFTEDGLWLLSMGSSRLWRVGMRGRWGKWLAEDAGVVHLRREDKNNNYLTPLMLAAKLGHLGVCRALVEAGAEVYSHPFNSYPPVILAAWGKHQGVVDYFLNEIPEKAAGTMQMGVALNLAARMGWTEVVRKWLVRDPLAVHQRGWIGDTALHWPSHNDHVEIVGMLLAAGADVNAEECNWIGGMPLHWASERAVGAMRLLLDAGAAVNARVTRPGSGFLGATPLIWCATQKDDCAEAAEILIKAGAEVGAVDAKGRRR